MALRRAVAPVRAHTRQSPAFRQGTVRLLSSEPQTDALAKAKGLWAKADGRTHLLLTVGAAFGFGMLLRRQFGGNSEPDAPPSPPSPPPPPPTAIEEVTEGETADGESSNSPTIDVTVSPAANAEVEATAEEEGEEETDGEPQESDTKSLTDVEEQQSITERKEPTSESSVGSLLTSEGEAEEGELKEKYLHYDYVLVGAGTASYAALKEILERDPSASVLIVGEEEVEPYMRPPLTKDVWKQEANNDTASSLLYVHSGKRLSLRYHTNRWYDRLENVHTMFGMTVKSLNPNAKMLVLNNKNMTVVSFEKCLLATGSSQVIPSDVEVAEDAKASVSFYQTINDFARVQEVVNSGGRVVVVGDGLVASELSSSLVTRGSKTGAEVVQITQEAGLLRASLPPYLSDCATKKVEMAGVKVVTNSPVSSIEALEGRPVVVLDSGERVDADLVVMAAAESPNVEFGAAYLEVDQQSGGFVVNQELQARSGIYAAGDVASFYDSALGRRRLSHYDHAYESGIVAGRNMTGDSQAYAYQPMHWGQIGDLEFYSVGACHAEPFRTLAFWSKPPEKHRLAMVAEPGQDYKRGVIYYLREDNVVMGVLLWGMRPKSSDLEAMRRLIYKNNQPYYHADQLKDRITLQDWSDEEYELALGPPSEVDPSDDSAAAAEE